MSDDVGGVRCQWCRSSLGPNEIHRPTRPFYPCESANGLLERVKACRIECERGQYGDEKPWTWDYLADLLRDVEATLGAAAHG